MTLHAVAEIAQRDPVYTLPSFPHGHLLQNYSATSQPRN